MDVPLEGVEVAEGSRGGGDEGGDAEPLQTGSDDKSALSYGAGEEGVVDEGAVSMDSTGRTVVVTLPESSIRIRFRGK